MTGGRVAVVTGAGRGIGAAVVRQLAADGWAVDRGDPQPRDARFVALASAAWTCSPEASAITGSVLHADGGITG